MRLETVQGSGFDLNTHEGRLMALQLVAIAAYESGNKSDRVKCANQRLTALGACLFPPARTWDKGNACLGRFHFATDRSNLQEHQAQRAATQTLIDQRKRTYKERTGNELTDQNFWLQGRLAEVAKLDAIIERLEEEASTSAISGAGVGGGTRPAIPPPPPVTHGAHDEILNQARNNRPERAL